MYVYDFWKHKMDKHGVEYKDEERQRARNTKQISREKKADMAYRCLSCGLRGLCYCGVNYKPWLR